MLMAHHHVLTRYTALPSCAVLSSTPEPGLRVPELLAAPVLVKDEFEARHDEREFEHTVLLHVRQSVDLRSWHAAYTHSSCDRAR